jgi:HEPN domain-containing protein
MQPEKIAEVKVWFQKASNDLRGADIDFAASPPFIEDVLFHCQQAVEKAMKGFLTAHDKVFRKTHDLDALAIVCETIDPTLADARDLTVFAWEFRYPGETEVPSEGEARKSLAIARRAYEEILSRLPKEVQP